MRLFITRYKLKAQCRDIQTSENCVPKGRDIYTEFIEPTYLMTNYDGVISEDGFMVVSFLENNVYKVCELHR